jgi:hypothetical protein
MERGAIHSPKGSPKTETRPHDEDTLAPSRGHRETPPWETKWPHDEAICSDPEVAPSRGHILFATPLPPLKTPREDLLEYVASVIKQQLDEHEARRAAGGGIIQFRGRARVA